MRVGDLDALKKEVENLVVGGAKGLKDYYKNGSKSDEQSWIGGVYDAWELICNAPTVVNEYTKGFADGERSGRNFPLTDEEKAILVRQWRPKGEWIDYSEDYGYAECPFCEHLTNCEDNIDELHYCWNCGAKLGKEVKKNDK